MRILGRKVTITHFLNFTDKEDKKDWWKNRLSSLILFSDFCASSWLVFGKHFDRWGKNQCDLSVDLLQSTSGHNDACQVRLGPKKF